MDRDLAQLEARPRAHAQPGRAPNMLHAVLDASPDCTMLIERDGTLSYISDNGRCAMSLDGVEIMSGTAWVSLYPETAQAALGALLEAALSGEATNREVWIDSDRMGTKWWMFHLSPVVGAYGQTDRILCVSRQLCRMDASETIRREADHRIKNSLASISSLLRIQARAQDDAVTADALNNASRRVMSVAHVHGHLELPDIDDDTIVCAQSYLPPLISELTDGLGDNPVTLLHRIAPMTLTPAQATALGLIATEAVINALRHGFGHDPQGGLIHVSLTPEPDGIATLSIANTGKQLPEGFDWSASRGLGQRVIDLYARSLGGEATFANAPFGGVRLDVTF